MSPDPDAPPHLDHPPPEPATHPGKDQRATPWHDAKSQHNTMIKLS